MSERILDYIKPINEDTNELAGDTSAIPTSHRILDYVKDIQGDTNTIVQEGGGGSGGGSCDCKECTDSEIQALFQ